MMAFKYGFHYFLSIFFINDRCIINGLGAKPSLPINLSFLLSVGIGLLELLEDLVFDSSCTQTQYGGDAKVVQAVELVPQIPKTFMIKDDGVRIFTSLTDHPTD